MWRWRSRCRRCGAADLQDGGTASAEGADALALTVLSAVLDGYRGARLERALTQGADRVADSAGASNGLWGRGPQLFMLDGVPATGQDRGTGRGRVARAGGAGRARRRVRGGAGARQDAVGGVRGLQARLAVQPGARAGQRTGRWACRWTRASAWWRGCARSRAAQVQAVAARYFGDDQLTVATLRPAADGCRRKPKARARRPACGTEEFDDERCRSFVSRSWSPAGGLVAVAASGPAPRCRSSTGPSPVAPRCTWCKARSLPMVDVQIDFDAGSRRDPADKAGLASVTASMASRGLRADGAEPALDENALGEAWADLGASFGASASADRMGFSLRSLTYPDLLPKVVALAARQLAQPAFPAAGLAA